MMDLWRIGKKLKAARKAKNLTQAQVKEITGIDRTIISRIENGKFEGAVRILELYVNFLDLQFSVEPIRYPDLSELSTLFDE